MVEVAGDASVEVDADVGLVAFFSVAVLAAYQKLETAFFSGTGYHRQQSFFFCRSDFSGLYVPEADSFHGKSGIISKEIFS